jgi:hypothetical protein
VGGEFQGLTRGDVGDLARFPLGQAARTFPGQLPGCPRSRRPTPTRPAPIRPGKRLGRIFGGHLGAESLRPFSGPWAKGRPGGVPAPPASACRLRLVRHRGYHRRRRSGSRSRSPPLDSPGEPLAGSLVCDQHPDHPTGRVEGDHRSWGAQIAWTTSAWQAGRPDPLPARESEHCVLDVLDALKVCKPRPHSDLSSRRSGSWSRSTR